MYNAHIVRHQAWIGGAGSRSFDSLYILTFLLWFHCRSLSPDAAFLSSCIYFPVNASFVKDEWNEI